MAGGLVGYLGYDMVRQMEKLPEKTSRRDRRCRKRLMTCGPSLFAIFDNVTVTGRTGHWSRRFYPSPEVSAARWAWVAGSGAGLDDAEAALERPLPRQPPAGDAARSARSRIEFHLGDEFLAACGARCKDYVMAGRRVSDRGSASGFSVPFGVKPPPVLRYCAALRRINPAPFLVYLDLGSFSVVASSPEVLVHCVTVDGNDPAAGRSTCAAWVTAGGRPGAGNRSCCPDP